MDTIPFGHKALLAGGLIQTLDVHTSFFWIDESQSPFSGRSDSDEKLGCGCRSARASHKALLAGGLIQTPLRSASRGESTVTKPF